MGSASNIMTDSMSEVERREVYPMLALASEAPPSVARGVPKRPESAIHCRSGYAGCVRQDSVRKPSARTRISTQVKHQRKIYLINVGANTSHWSKARSPIFPDGSFRFVSFPTELGVPYPAEMMQFTRGGGDGLRTHLDPDWTNLTYGDTLNNGRGGALRKVRVNDVLLFWGLLWANAAGSWDAFTGEHGWYLFGAMRVAWIMEGGQTLQDLPDGYLTRASANAHLNRGLLNKGDRIFIADPASSALFHKAVDLGAERADGLMYRAFVTKAGVPLALGGLPHWSGTLRACRCMFDLENAEDRKRAELVHTAIRVKNRFDLLTRC
jgi:Nucleotide modification associated domain 3